MSGGLDERNTQRSEVERWGDEQARRYQARRLGPSEASGRCKLYTHGIPFISSIAMTLSESIGLNATKEDFDNTGFDSDLAPHSLSQFTYQAVERGNSLTEATVP